MIKTTLIMASTIDGKISINHKKRLKFSSIEDKKLLYKLREKADCIIRGGINARVGDTPMIIKDERIIQKRLKQGLSAHPLNVIISRTLEFDFKNSKIFSYGSTKKVIFTPKNVDKKKLKIAKGYADIIQIESNSKGDINLIKVLKILEKKYKCKIALLEGGGELNYYMLDKNLVDELFLTICPYIIGGEKGSRLVNSKLFLNPIKKFKLVKIKKSKYNEVFLHYLKSEEKVNLEKIKNGWSLK